MKKVFQLALILFVSLGAKAQIVLDSSVTDFLSNYPKVNIVPIARDTSYWRTNSKAEFLFSENYYRNWNSGGQDQVAGVLKFDLNAIYNKAKISWINNMRMEYGLNKQANTYTRKTSDIIDFTSTAGYKVIERWYASSQFKFNTQFSNGYDYKSDGNHIVKSSFMAPARLFLGIGARYTLNDDFFMYVSPFTANTTLVLNEELAERGDINKNGEMIYNKIGPLIDLYWNYNFYKTYALTNKLSVYSDYVHSFGSIDYFDWQLDLSLPLHKYFTVSFGTHTRYQRDILFDVEDSTTGEKETRVQFRQLLGIGLKYEI